MLTLTREDFETEGVFPELTLAIAPAVETFRHALQIFATIDAERAARDRSVARLLLN